MRRFTAPEPRVKKASGSYFLNAPPGSVRDRSTGERATLLTVDLDWMSPSQAEVSGGSYRGALDADGGVYRLSKQHGRWVVERYQLAWVS